MRLTTFAALLLLGSALVAQDKPNFSGTWKLDTAKSEFGSFPPPDSLTLKVDHQDPKVHIVAAAVSQMGEENYEFNMTTDGAETTGDMRGTPVKFKGKWDGQAMVFDSSFTTDNGDVAVHDRWTLAGDGKTMTLERHWTGAFGETDQKLVNVKQ